MRLFYFSIVTILCLCISNSSKGQIFSVSNYKVSGCIYDSPENLKKQEISTLGSKIALDFYDTKLKISLEIDKEATVIVLNKMDDVTYKIVEKGNNGPVTVILKLDKLLGYIRSISLTEKAFVSDKQICTHSLTAKRL